jgi:hypothetical protein
MQSQGFLPASEIADPHSLKAASLCYQFGSFSLSSEFELPELGAPISGRAQKAKAMLSIAWAQGEARDGGAMAMVHRWPEADGGMALYRDPLREDLRLEFPELSEFTLTGNGGTITVGLGPRAGIAIVRHLLLDQMLPRVLAHRGETVLHASAVRIGARAVGFMGKSRSGKSTLAAALAAGDSELLSDDGLILELATSAVLALPTYTSLRLWPDSWQYLQGKTPRESALRSSHPKHRIAWPSSRPRDQRVPLAALYCVEESTAGAMEIVALSPLSACMAFVANCFQLDPTDADRPTRLLRKASAILSRLPVFSLRVPRDFGRLPEVRAKLLDHVQAVQPKQV